MLITGAALEELSAGSFTGQRVMLIGAHPDDIEGFAGGFAALLAESGALLEYVVVTNGDKGCSASFCSSFPSEQLALLRRAEALAAASILNVSAAHVTLLDYEDCFSLQASDMDALIRNDLIALVRRLQPFAVFTLFPYPQFALQPSQWGDTGYHPDHQRVGRLALDAATWGAKVHRLLPELGAGWVVSQFYFFCFEAKRCTHFVDVQDGIDLQIEAFLQHKTQYANGTAVAESIRRGAAELASVSGQPIKYAELYQAYF